MISTGFAEKARKSRAALTPSAARRRGARGRAPSAFFLLLLTTTAAPAGSVSLPSDRPLSGSATLLTVHAAGGGPVLILADGWLAPGSALRAELRLTVDGAPVGSRAVLDWHGAHHPVTHGFRVLAAPTLAAGDHVVLLSATSDAPSVIGAGSLLSVLEHPAARVAQRMAPSPQLVVQTNTPAALADTDTLPHDAVARLNAGEAHGPIIALAAGSIAYDGDGSHDFGDALWGVWVDGVEQPANTASYADNDICRCAELAAPLALQAMFGDGPVSGHTIGIGATAEPWVAKLGPDTVRYRVLPESVLVVLAGGMDVVGGLTVLDPAGDRVKRFPYLCVASTHAFAGCPAAGTARQIGAADVSVPPGSARATLFSAALRVQGDGHDGGGRFEAWLELDGQRVGSPGRQDLSPASPVSTRTVTLSYLVALTPGRHHVALAARATGDFWHLAVTRNLPLVWFD